MRGITARTNNNNGIALDGYHSKVSPRNDLDRAMHALRIKLELRLYYIQCSHHVWRHAVRDRCRNRYPPTDKTAPVQEVLLSGEVRRIPGYNRFGPLIILAIKAP